MNLINNNSFKEFKNQLQLISLLEIFICLLALFIPILGETIYSSEFLWFFGLIPALILAYRFGLVGGLFYATIVIITKGTIDILRWFENDISNNEMAIIFSNLFAILIISPGIGFLTDRLRKKNYELGTVNQNLAKANAKLTDMTVKDSLTNLYNHRYFQQDLKDKLLKSQELNIPFTLIMGDIDFFRKYNATYGHVAGDNVLKSIAQIFNNNKRSNNDLAARYGGEEFVLTLWGLKRKEGLNVAEKIRKEVEDYPICGEETQPNGKLTMSIGVASYPEDANNKDSLLQVLDSALMQTKTASKNKVGVYYSVLYALANSLNQSEQELINSIKALITIIHAKDRYTFAHSERVVKYSLMIGRGLGLSDEFIRLLEIGAFLHDIGKIEVSEKVLKKPGALEKHEWEEMKKHTITGAELIAAVDTLVNCREMILNHHERYDGNGYPHGIAGEDIPLLARIVMLADSFDAMTTDRPYKKGKTLEEALVEIEKCAGSQFDPNIVPVFKEALLSQYEQISKEAAVSLLN